MDIDGRKTISSVVRSNCDNGTTYNFDQRTNIIFVNKESNLQIFNLAGLLVKDKKNTREMNISDLPGGIYVLKINSQYYKITRL